MSSVGSLTEGVRPITDTPVVFRGSPERQLRSQDSSSGGGPRLAEVAGGTTAECAAVCCCCPCAVASLALLAVYKVPAGLCRKALKNKRRRRLMKKRLIYGEGHQHHARCQCGCDDTDLQFHSVSGSEADILVKSLESDEDVTELENEMWDNFYSAGFWRSSSKKFDKCYDSD